MRLLGLPRPAHIAVLVVLRLVEAHDVGMQIAFDVRQGIWGSRADEPREHEGADVLADRLQHRQQRQRGGAGHGAVHFGISPQNRDDVMRHGVDGVFVDFAHRRNGIGQLVVGRARVDCGKQAFDGGMLQVLDQRRGGIVRRGCEHECLGAQPAR